MATSKLPENQRVRTGIVVSKELGYNGKMNERGTMSPVPGFYTIKEGTTLHSNISISTGLRR